MSKPRPQLGVFQDTALTQPTPATERRTDRIGRTAMPFWVPVAARKQLKVMAAEMDTTQQELMTLALNDFFKKHGKPPIA
jgi:23S rRNA A2030 N6-methylase RlmJ